MIDKTDVRKIEDVHQRVFLFVRSSADEQPDKLRELAKPKNRSSSKSCVTEKRYQSKCIFGATWPRNAVNSAKERKVRTSDRGCRGCNRKGFR